MDVEPGQGSIVRHKSVDPLDSAQNLHQRRLTRDHHGPAALLHGRRIANELQRVAQTLLGVQKNRAPCQRAAIPTRLGEFSAGVILAFPPPFIFGKTANDVSLPQQLRGAREMGIGQIRIEPSASS